MTTAYYSHRPPLRRNSPVSLYHQSNGFAADAPMMQRIDVGDSSEDEIPQPMKFSALTRALLESDAPEQLSSPKQEHAEGEDESKSQRERRLDTDTPSRAPQVKITATITPAPTRNMRALPMSGMAMKMMSKTSPTKRQKPSRYQEPPAALNMPPPTFKRNKDSKPGVLSAKVLTAETPVPAVSGNTPHRPAPPPPPKMNMSDMATKPAGASVTRTKKRRPEVNLKGKLFTQLGRLGKGGSSDVYSVMAENKKLFALKRVKLGDCDEAAVRGYKGEIDLLQKLENVERVIRLYDWELDESRGTLSLLMEPGEGDLNRVLSQVLGGPEPKLDTVFIRWWWREMLSCVSAVHAYDIVHSDLKPANFLVVGGRLKLIDFGIANAIETDLTMNVHRDSHIGTPNYMSPESITDTNAPMPGQTRDAAAGRVMKLGKPSDVWSLGCILYQMVYGRPPFAHIPNQIHRVLAITNSKIVIEFPAQGLGGVPVPPELKGTLRRYAMLSENDPWLYPEAAGRVHVGEELLAAIIGRVVEKCKKGEAPAEAGVGDWARGFLGSVRRMVELEGVKEGLPEA
ncbi:kinase-like protein [Myriangium duriaei CBS 260.36]|uniref:Kinase-like protein n=1 Tax=Myriangium duriaei CBS 260.36 TaxID=1168546 RepID=A0A9P4IWN3_9PEZI|nr:kinase-like protein [Myriangium duriaei CBS 260.36]